MTPQKRRVRIWLADHGKTQQWLADELGVSESLVSLILAGRRPITPELRRALYTITRLRLQYHRHEGVGLTRRRSSTARVRRTLLRSALDTLGA